MEQKLFTEMTVNHELSSITARCPDEDDEMCITIKNRYKVNFSMSLQEAKDFADFINAHVQNAIESNS